MTLETLRKSIDHIDEQILVLFRQRMDLALEIAKAKQAENAPVFHPVREQEILKSVETTLGRELAPYGCTLFRTLFAVSREYQSRILRGGAPARGDDPPCLPADATRWPALETCATRRPAFETDVTTGRSALETDVTGRSALETDVTGRPALETDVTGRKLPEDGPESKK